MRCTGLTAFWCPNCGDCTCPRTDDGDVPEMSHDSCPLHARGTNHPIPEEGKVVALPPDADEELRIGCEFMGIPVITSSAVPAGMVFVIDLDKLKGEDDADRPAS